MTWSEMATKDPFHLNWNFEFIFVSLFKVQFNLTLHGLNHNEISHFAWKQFPKLSVNRFLSRNVITLSSHRFMLVQNHIQSEYRVISTWQIVNEISSNDNVTETRQSLTAFLPLEILYILIGVLFLNCWIYEKIFYKFIEIDLERWDLNISINMVPQGCLHFVNKTIILRDRKSIPTAALHSFLSLTVGRRGIWESHLGWLGGGWTGQGPGTCTG